MGDVASTTVVVATTTVVSIITSPSTTSTPNNTVPAHGPNPAVAFMIGLSIILLASIMNAAGLNLTKFDHVRMSSVPKSQRRKDWMRPIWLLGMILYIISQLIGSTLALEYMRAEYVAPLGSSSLVFNFLFAYFLIGTPVTKNDIWGTIVIVLGVIGIVAFGSINSGLSSETDAAHLTALWRRGGWLGYFFAMATALYLVIIFTSCLDGVLAARTDLSTSRPTTGARPSFSNPVASRRGGIWGRLVAFVKSVKAVWEWSMSWITDLIEHWASPKDDKQIAWTLGIGWACCGGALAGGTLVFAKATVKLISGSLSHQNSGNQFGHVAVVFTMIFLAVTAVMQIICLNRGLRVYESTLVVPVFYGVYTATGFLNSLIFNNEVGAYKSWTLFLIFVSMIILIGGVVLLTHKKPEPVTTRIRGVATPRTGLPSSDRRRRRVSDEEAQAGGKAGNAKSPDGERLWDVGEISDSDEGDDPDIDHHLNPTSRPPSKRRNSNVGGSSRNRPRSASGTSIHGRVDPTSETAGLMTALQDEEDDADADVEDSGSDAKAFKKKKEQQKGKGGGKVGRRRSMDPFRDGVDEDSEMEAFGMSRVDRQGRNSPSLR